MRSPPSSMSFCQQGAALVVALMTLAVLTLIGINAMGTSSLELLMASNSKLQGDTLAQAEDTLVAAEGSIEGTTIDFTKPGYYALPLNIDLSNPTCWPPTPCMNVGSVDINGKHQGEYVVEYLGSNGIINVNRITVHSKGLKGAERIIQATYKNDSPTFLASSRYSWVELHTQ